MRYSMLVYLTRMGQTLLEAAEYLATRPKEDPVRRELLKNGLQMMGQMRAELERHRQDLKSGRPIDCLNEAEEKWRGGEECASVLRELVECLPREARYRIRAVFLAELGEKWDSMDSVYRFMRDDPRFDTVVVLTPVFRKAQETEDAKREVIYKDYLTPMGIPFVHYKEYKLEEDLPDMVFTSQPYESCSLKEFWPVHIARQTRLVYLPYFLPSIVLKDYPTVLCRMTIYTVAWKVIGSGQKHYKYYQKYSRHGGGNMLVTGVPKMDPIIRAKENGVPLPPGWECIQGKKVFLWNSWFDITFSSLRFFREIFDWFQQHPDCALIWRPHPMTEAVTKVLYSERTDYIRQCKEQIKAAPNAILDEETSYLAAFVYSDAQISDHSSLMQQYLPMDKPLLWVEIPAFDPTGEEFISTQWMERANSASDVLRFLEQTRQGADPNAELRKTIYQRDMPLIDGHCGERICEALWEALHTEDGLTQSHS